MVTFEDFDREIALLMDHAESVISKLLADEALFTYQKLAREQELRHAAWLIAIRVASNGDRLLWGLYEDIGRGLYPTSEWPTFELSVKGFKPNTDTKAIERLLVEEFESARIDEG